MSSLGVFAALILLALPCSTLAQLPLARLYTVFPPGGKAGTTVAVSISGADLDEVDRLHFTHTGITAKPKPAPNQFEITIASNTPPGIYEARIIGRFGLSNPRAFVVGDRPEVICQAGNTSLATAMEIPLGTTVTGTADANSADCFKFVLTKGRRVLIDCQAMTIDSRMEAALLLYSADGRELERSRHGVLLDFTAPADGPYLLKVHDFLYRGGGEYFYRLTVGTGPHLDFVVPSSGAPGAKVKCTLYGRNLPGSTPARDLVIGGKPLEQLLVEIAFPQAGSAVPQPALLADPPQAVVDGFEYRLATPAGVSNPILLSFADAPVVLEQANNDKPESAQKVTVPCEFTGQFHPARDVDWLSFDAKKGEVYWLDMFSHRLGLPTDPFVRIQRVVNNDKGQPQGVDVLEMHDTDANIGGAEFKTSTLDPVARFEVKEDGNYRVRVQDLFNLTVSDPRHVYRLVIRKETPDFRLAALPEAPPPVDKNRKEANAWTTVLRRGECLPIQVLVFRRDGFGGEIQLSAEGLPAGVTCAGAKIEAGKNSALLILSAADNAAPWVGPFKIVGKAKAGPGDLAREARAGCVLWNVGDYTSEPVHARLANGPFLAVTDKETAPLTVLPAESNAREAAEGAKLQVQLKIVRRGEFKEALKLKTVGLSALDKLKELEVAGAATNALLEIDLTQFKLAPGTYSFHLQAETKGAYRNNPEAAAQADSELKAAEKAVADLAAEAKRATDTLPAAVKAADEAAAQARAIVDTAKEMAAATQAKAAADAKAAAMKIAQEAATKANAAELKKTAAAQLAQAAGAAAAQAQKAAHDLAATGKVAGEAAAQARAVADKQHATAKAADDARTAALRAAQGAATKDAEALATAAKAAAEAAIQAKALADKEEAEATTKAKASAEAKVAADKAATDALAKQKEAEATKLAADRETQVAATCAAEAKQANDALAAAAKTADQAAAAAREIADRNAAALAKAKATADAKAGLGKTIREAPDKAKEAEAKKAAAANLAKATAERAKPREVTIMVYSAPITISVTPAAKK